MTEAQQRAVTTIELAAFLGVTQTAIRVMAHRHKINPVGKQGRSNLYHPKTFIAAVGSHDRRHTA
jgi:hypothetical protein